MLVVEVLTTKYPEYSKHWNLKVHKACGHERIPPATTRIPVLTSE